MKIPKPTRLELWLFLPLGFVIFAGLFLSYCASEREMARSNSCQCNLNQLGLALRQYQVDYVSRFPINTSGWTEEIQPELKTYSLFHCPSHANMGDKFSQKGYLSYWLNGRLLGLPGSRIKSPIQTLLLGEGDDGTDTSNGFYTKKSLPLSWLDNSSKPPSRHQGSANYLFVDGHVAHLSPHQVEHFGGRANPFSPR